MLTPFEPRGILNEWLTGRKFGRRDGTRSHIGIISHNFPRCSSTTMMGLPLEHIKRSPSPKPSMCIAVQLRRHGNGCFVFVFFFAWCSRAPRVFKAWRGGGGTRDLQDLPDCPPCTSAGTLRTTGPPSLYVGQVWVTRLLLTIQGSPSHSPAAPHMGTGLCRGPRR